MNFSELDLHPTVAAALAKRGYETATPVQAAVLHPDAAGRDLLVSSQTGSGKTIAFGAVLAADLLAPEAARTGNQRVNPLALVIVPTRELAVQVRDELGWLLRETKLRLASFTGGTPVTGDLRTLQKGLDIAIGTPGRLVDLLRRQRLELAEIRVVVLDEADEMLDLGFREDLQTILQAAPETRRTLMLSATLPAEIQALARRFQRDALRVDPRKDGDQGARGAHGDITFVAHLIAGADRLPVVVNILRAAGDGRAIVFCTTREAVSRLHAALLSRGFTATAMSGDRAQAERDRALDQVRKGDARILVATNVAARGIHLPEVDLIIHADLPLNPESLTHRSGRTGRAGRKGTAVLIASLTERRKAERLLMAAHVPVVWTAPPSAESITAAARERLEAELLEEANAGAGRQEDPAAEEMVTRLEAVLPARELARRLLLRELTHLPVGERVHSVPVPGPERRDRFAPASSGGDGDRGGQRPGRQAFAREGVKFRVNIGAKDNADPRWLLPLICRRGGVSSRDVGAIRVGPSDTVFEISGDVVRDFELSAAERDPRAPHVFIERLNGAPAGRAPSAQSDRAPSGRGPVDRGRTERDRPAPSRAPARPPGESGGAKAPTHAAEMSTPPAPTVAAKPKKERPAAPDANAAPTTDAAPVVATAPVATVPAKALVAPAKATAKTAAAPAVTAAPTPAAPKAATAAKPTPSTKATPSTAPPAVIPAAATAKSSAPTPAPASIFQTRTPVAAPTAAPRKDISPAEHTSRAGGTQPMVEMKRAPRIGGNGQRPAPAAPPSAPARAPAPAGDGGGDHSGGGAAKFPKAPHAPKFGGPQRRTDGNNAPRRAAPRESLDARPSGGPRAHAAGGGFGPPRSSARGFDGPAPRGPGSSRAAPGGAGRPPGDGFRGNGGPGRPSAGARPGPARPHSGRPAQASNSGADSRPGSPRPPFWKEGARKRVPAPGRGAEGAGGPKSKVPQR